MKIKSLNLKNVRNFFGETQFDFSETKSITTISGKNGSGKTTVFKSLVLCQKAFFLSQLLPNSYKLYKDGFDSELKKIFTGKDSYLEIKFEFEGELGFDCSFKVICTHFSSEKLEWITIYSDENAESRIKKYWNLENPSEIIVFISSDKHFIEEDISHENISVKVSSNNQLIIDTILNPEKIFSNIYQTLINDYIKERLIPSKPKRDLYYLPTKVFLSDLLPNITLSNFTSQELENQFILLGKLNDSIHKNSFDIRNFSSGEKTIFYLLLFINYVQKIRLLIIDEPENHFHEELLVKFLKLLNEICNTKRYTSVIEKVAKQRGISLSPSNLRELNKYYENYNLSQVFLLTHSKNLIYNNFSDGANYYLEKEFKKIEYDRFEKTLREIGLSSIYSKVLFVEGTKETEFFDLFFNEYNIKTHSLNGCGTVIDTYKRILDIKEHLRDNHFCFLIDRDTRSVEEINKIRDRNVIFFDEHFIVLDKHEFENYLLEPQIFKDIILTHSTLYNKVKEKSLTEITDIISGIAKDEKQHVIRKTVLKKNSDSIDGLKELLLKKETPLTSFQDYNKYIQKLLSSSEKNLLDNLKSDLLSNYSTTISDLSDEKWEAEWNKLCDGKIVLAKTVTYFSKYLEIKNNRLNNEIKNNIFNSTNKYEIKKIIEQILEKFE